MSSTPSFASTVNNGSKVLGGFDASFTAPSTTTTIITAGTSGAKIEEIAIQGLATLAAGIVNLWLHDGSTYFLFDQFALTTSPTASTTVAAFRVVRQYSNLILKSGWTLRASHTTTGNDTSKIAVHAFGGDA